MNIRPNGRGAEIAGMSTPEFAQTVDQHVGRSVAELRERRGLDQKALAAAMRISEAQLQAYEAGRKRLRPVDLLMLARLLVVNPSQFFLWAENGEAVTRFPDKF